MYHIKHHHQHFLAATFPLSHTSSTTTALSPQLVTTCCHHSGTTFTPARAASGRK
jgi:hypothetical protein